MARKSKGICGAGLAAVLAAIPMAGCGMVPPKLTEAWEAQDVGTKMVLEIKRKIFCETIFAIREVNSKRSSLGPPIPNDYGVQLQLTLTIAESSSFTPNINYTRTLADGTQSGVSIGQSWGVGISGELSSTATRTDTTYTYWRVGAIAAPGKNKDVCPDEWPYDSTPSSPFLKSDLGIKRFLQDNVKAAVYLHSSKLGEKKPDNVDVYSYDLKFAVVSTGGISPQFKLVSLSGGGTPILNLNRTRTHELLLTFGPTGPGGFQPSEISFSQHLTNQLNSSLSRRPIP